MQNNAMMAVDAAAESPLPEIDPARVVVDGLPEIDPAQVIPDKPAADPRRKKLVRKMFQEGDPFAIFEPTERKRLSELNLDVRDQKQIMLAAFFADGDGKRFDWAYSNLRGLTDQIFGKDFDTDRAFAEVCKIYEKPADQGFVMKTDGSKAGEVGHALKSGIGRIGADVLKTVKMAAEKPSALALIADLLIPNNAWQQMRERAVAMTPLNDWIDTYDKYTEYESAAANMKGDWFSNSDSVGDWVFQVLKGIVAEAPSMAVQFGAWAVSPGTGIAVTAGSSAAGKHYDLQSEEIDPRLKLLNALLTGTVNGALERITGGIIRGKGAEKVVNEGLKKGYKKALLYFGKNMLKEGAQEFSEQLAENTVDMFTGVGGGTLGERARHLLRGTGESAVIGMFYGGAGSVPGYVSALDVERRNELIRRTAEQEIERIKGIANASDEQIRQMKELQTLLESDDLGKAVDLIVTNRMKEDAARKREQEIEDAETPELGYEIADGMDKETVLKAKEAEEWLAIRNTLRHNPQDTEDAVAEASVFYRDTAFHIVHGRGDYPADVQAEMERIGKNPDQIRAFTYDGNVYVNADRVRPSEVPALLLHEVVGHKGLRAVFGKDFDLLLDSVVKEHLNDQDFRRIAEQYQCDLETVDGARYAAEEYLARYAEQHGAGIKPKWWKETLQRIRVFLSKHHLYRNVRFTDAEIEVALARSIRHTRKQWNNKTIEQGSKKEEDGEDSEIARLRSGESARSRDVRFAVNEKFNEELEKQRNGTLEAGHIYQLGMPPQVLLDTGVPDLPIELSAARLAEKAGTAHHPFGIEEVRSLPLALEHPIGVFAYGNKEKAQNIVVELQKDGKHFIVGLSLKFEHDGLIVNSIRGLYPKDTHEWLNWIQQGKALYLDKEKIQSMIAQQRRNPADVSYLDLDSLEKIVQDFRNVKEGKDKKEERISNRGQGSKKEKDGKGGVRFSVAPVWTGSAADYEQPSLQYIGTGEGAQVYGWGLYGSESEQVARWYAKADVERKNSAKILLDGKEYDLHEIAGVEGDIAADVLEDVLDRKGSTSGTMTFYRSWINKSSGEEEEIYRRRLEWLEKNKDRIQYVPEKEESGRRHLYRQTFFAGREENLLDWDKPVTEEQRKKIAMQLKMEELYLTGDPDEASAELRELRRRQREGEDISGEELDAAYDKASRLHAQRNVIGKTLNGDVPSGSMVYENLEEILGEPQAVSEFLYRAGIDGVTYIGNSSNVRNYVAFSDQDIRVDEHIRFSIEEYSAEEQERIIDLMRPFVGKYADKEDSEYADFLAKRGIAASEQDARYFASQAAKDNLSAARKREKEVETKWHYEHNFWIMHLTDFTGTSDFKIRPSFRFQNEDFSGTFISEPWRNKGKKFTPKNARDAERHRRKLETADGYASDELAKAIARKTGGDELEIEQQLIDYFRNLTKPDLHKQYKAFKDSETFGDRVADREMREAWEAREENRISMELEDILTNGRQITEEYLAKEPEVVKRLAQQLLGNGERKYYKVYKNDLEAINAALRQEEGDASGYAQGYRAGRKESAKEFREKLKADREKAWEAFKERVKKLREAVMADRKDIQSAQKIQQEAWKLAKELLPREHRDEFVKSIIRLSSYNNFATKAYPEGKRKAMFDELIGQVTQRGGELRRDKAIGEMLELVKRNRAKRTAKNNPYSPLGERQKTLDRIGQILRMDPDTYAAIMRFALDKQATVQEAEENLGDRKEEIPVDIGKLENEIFCLEHFGGLRLKKPEVAEKSLKLLKDFIQEGRDQFRMHKEWDAAQFQMMRNSVIKEMSGGTHYIPSELELDMKSRPVDDFLRMSESITRMLEEFSRTDNPADLEKSQAGKLLAEVDRSTQKEQTRMNRMQRELDEILKNECGIKGLIERGRFLNGAMKEEDTGIEILDFGIKYDKEKPPIWGRHPRRRAGMHAEHCRKMLEDLNKNPENPVIGFLPFGMLGTAKTIREDLKAAGVRTGRYFSVCVLKDGNFRIYTENEAGETIGTDVPRDAMQAACRLMRIDDTALFNIEDITIAVARERLFEYDAGAVAPSKSDFGDDVDNAAYDEFLKSEDLPDKIELVSESPATVSRQLSLKLSPGAGMQLVLTWEQKHYQPSMAWNGWSEQKIQEVRDWLDSKHPGYLKLAYALREQIKKDRPELDAAVFERYGVHLPENENFFYATFKGVNPDQIMDAGFGNMAGGMTVSANFLTARRMHLQPPDTKANAISLFMMKQLEQNHFIAWTQTVRKLRAVYGNKNVQNVMIHNFGVDAWKNFKEKIELLASNGALPDRAVKFVNQFYKNWAPSNIALNMSSAAKQIAGGTAYALYVPTGSLLKHVTEANPMNPDYRAWLDWVKKHYYTQNRQAGGLDPSLAGLLNYTRGGAKVSPVSDRAMQLMMKPTLVSDYLSSITWGYGAFRYYQELGKQKGMKPQEAFDFADRMWQRATDETQQSGYLKDANHFSSRPGLWRYLTTYMTNPMQTFALELSALRKYRRDKTKNNLKTWARRVAINHFVVPTLMNLVSSAFRHGADVGDYIEDWDDYVAGWLLGSFEGLWLFGKGGGMILGALLGDRYAASLEAIPLLSDLAADGLKIRKSLENPEIDSPEKVFDAMKISGDLMMSAGPAWSRTTGIALHALGMQGKRIVNWFKEK